MRPSQSWPDTASLKRQSNCWKVWAAWKV